MDHKGYIEQIGDFFSKHDISIDNIVSSETSITLTINQEDIRHATANELSKNLQKTLCEFEKNVTQCDVTVQHMPISEIYIGGEHIDSPGLIQKISTTLAKNSINISTIKQTASPHVVIIGVAQELEKTAVRALHATLIETA